jgi:hypothetical protein
MRDRIKICRVFVFDKEDYNELIQYIGKYPIEMSCDFNLNDILKEDSDVPTIIVGWEGIHGNIPKQSILKKEIKENLSWTFSMSEDEKEFYKDIDDFINDSIVNWLPKNFVLFDSIFNDDIYSFVDKTIDKNATSYVYFKDGAMYINNADMNLIINLKSLYLTEENFKSKITSFINYINPVCLSFSNICKYIDSDKINNIRFFENFHWIRNGKELNESYFNILPGMDLKKYIPFIMSFTFKVNELSKEERVFYKRLCDKDRITCWLSSRKVSFRNDFKADSLDFVYRENAKLASLNYSNKRTITGRIVCRDSYNPQNLPKGTRDRANIISRFKGGSIVAFDFVSFETRIALYMCDDKNFLNQYFDKDLHNETARLIFETNTPTEEQREISKTLNHSLLYGAGSKTLLDKLSMFENPDKKLSDIRYFLSPFIKTSRRMAEEYKDFGYIINKWGSIIRTEKSFAAFNNYIQSTAVEIIVDKLFELKKIMHNYNSEFMFQVHDSLVFDIHPSERFLINQIKDLLVHIQGMYFNIDVSEGPNYKDLKKINIQQAQI